MTLKELYEQIGGDYEQALRVLRMDKLIDKHIRKLPKGGVADALIAAGGTMDPTQLFETAHAVKGVCGNLGLTKMAEAASEITEEFRPGSSRKLSDEDIGARIRAFSELYAQAREGIERYEAESVQ